jgi:hypothetical protein
MVDDGERDAALEIGKGKAGALLRRLAVVILDRAASGAVMLADHAIEFAEQTLDHATRVALSDPKVRSAEAGLRSCNALAGSLER